MSIFGSIMSKIFGQKPAAAQDTAAPAATDTTAAPAPATPGLPSGTTPAVPTGENPTAATTMGGAQPQVDVDAVLTEMASKNGQSLNWKQSIVDLMKLLDLDSSLQARKELAQELNYTGDTNDSASMNIWLHKQVMQKLAANGGKVPAELRD